MKRKGSFKNKCQARKGASEEEIPMPLDDNAFEESDNEGSDAETPNVGFRQLCFTKEGKPKKKSGGFQSMGLSYPVLKGVLKKGYKVPTPIQRKTIPVIMDGKDVVAMARTGSGKTGAFLIPMLEKLKTRVAKTGARALIFSPTRELAMQTMKFTKELGRHTGLKSTLVLGGEKMEEQFAAIHEHPDIIIATPGRFLHLVMEMDLKLSSIEYIVFDEADRLFEMGFQEQIQEVLHRLPECRQTLMFSATLPRVLVDFVKAGLTDPVLIRLDVDMKLSENLKTIYLCCRSADKPAILLHLLKNVVSISDELTVVFLATRHHVDYVKDILEKASIPCSYVYSSLDQTARRIHVAKFRSKQVGVLLVTDIAARGIDIPLLDNVINYNFPSKPKLFVHRVGRVARAGRRGTAYSLVAPDEAPYLIDLHLFLGKPVTFTEDSVSEQDGICGYVPQTVIDDEADLLRSYHETSVDLNNMVKVCDNAYKQYSKSRPAPSTESVKRVKELFSNKIHPMFCSGNSAEVERSKFLANMKSYRPNSTIFEIGATAKCQASAIMRQKRKYHFMVDQNRSRSISSPNVTESESSLPKEQMTAATDADIQNVFTSVIIRDNSKNKKQETTFKDPENYLKYMSVEHYAEKGFSVQNNFEQDASGAVLDLTADDAVGGVKLKNAWRWDRKKKRFIKDDGSEMKKKMKTESGVWIPKSYKSDLYKKWQERNKISFQQNEGDSDGETTVGKHWKGSKGAIGKSRQNRNKSGLPQKREVKSKEEILKARKRRARQLAHQNKRHSKKQSKSNTRKGGSKDGGKRHGVKVKNKFVKSSKK